jgi:hypothetical protein
MYVCTTSKKLVLQRIYLSKPRSDCADSLLAGGVGKEIAWESIVKFRNRNQLPNLHREIRTHMALGSPKLPDQFRTAIDNGHQIFKISAGTKVIPAPVGEGFNLCSAEINRCDRSFLPLVRSIDIAL